MRTWRQFTQCSWRFNRYMVECEYISKPQLSLAATRFNRYMVECECGGYAKIRNGGREF